MRSDPNVDYPAYRSFWEEDQDWFRRKLRLENLKLAIVRDEHDLDKIRIELERAQELALSLGKYCVECEGIAADGIYIASVALHAKMRSRIEFLKRDYKRRNESINVMRRSASELTR